MNLYNKTYCLYRHLKPCGEVFYIGIGNEKRPYDKRNRSKFWKRIVKNYNYEIDILSNNVTKEEAIELEIILISYYGRRDLNQGTLCNMTDGGEGTLNKTAWNKGLKGYRAGEKDSKETILKRSNSLKGKELSKIHKNKIKKAKLGLPLSESHKKNISNALLKNSPSSKKVINVINKKMYNSIKEASVDSMLSYTALRAQLNGQNKNNSNFKLI